MPEKCENTNPLQRDGTSQIGRILAELQPSFARIFDWEHKDWCTFVYQFATIIRFYKKENNTHSGYWDVFFDQLSTDTGIENFLDQLKKTDDARAHLALLMSFIHLLDLVKTHINELTGKHLNFYYKSVLRLKNKSFTPDQVHIIFEAIKNAGNVRMEKDSVLKADKDPEGRQKYYKTNEELIVNEIQIEQLKTIFHYTNTNEAYDEGLFYANRTDMADGLEVPLEKGMAWNPFASRSWPKAAIGFTFASSILKLKEGDRDIYFHITLKNPPAGFTIDKEALMVQFTGEKGWLGPYPLKEAGYNNASKTMELNVEVPASESAIVPLNPKFITEPIKTSLPVARLQFNVNGQEDQKTKAAELLKALQGVEIVGVTIGVDVRGMKEHILENDFGPLEPSKPFMPFGPQPTKGSNLFIGNSEIFDKDWKNLSIDVTWKDLPLNDAGTLPDFWKHYYAYRKKFLSQNTKAKYDIKAGDEKTTVSGENDFLIKENGDFGSDMYILDEKNWKMAKSGPLFEFGKDPVTEALKTLYTVESNPDGTPCDFLPNPPELVPLPEAPEASGSGTISFGGGTSSWYYFGMSESVSFNFLSGKPIYYDLGALSFAAGAPAVPQLESYGASSKKGFIKITLQSSFYHKLYPVLYAMAMAETEDKDIILPNEPYTPFIEALTLNYQACISEEFNLTLDPNDPGKAEKVLENFNKQKIQLFQEGPFGFAQQHNFLKNSLSFLNSPNHKKIYLEPFYPHHGEFFIGLSNAAPQQTVSILFQFASGSENPLAYFNKEEEIKFWILASNEWRQLESAHLLKNTTNDFLQPGLFRFVIPKEATSKNTILPEGLIWLRATLPSGTEPDAICKLISIHTQAVEATFDNRGNNLQHLNSSLPAGTISKMIGRPAGIKNVSQPYNSFDGRPKEKSDDFYKRVSERLRHKQRAVSIWDYEALVLEQFPEIHKVRCLNHTRVISTSGSTELKELAPGYVTVVVIPDLNNKNAFNPLQPRVSRNTLSEVIEYIKPLCSKQVVFDVINPLYEEVKLNFKVLFHDGYDPNYYKTQLNSDLVAYLSPWMGGKTKEIQFGTYLYESMVIHFTDALPYVDMITDFSMKHLNEKKKKISPSNSAAILVSAVNHDIEVLDKALICLNE